MPDCPSPNWKKQGKVSTILAQICIIILMLSGCVSGPAIPDKPKDPHTVSFLGTHPMDSNFAGTLTLTGRLTKPIGEGPFPAIVLLHGCGGITANRDNRWVEKLISWGFVTLQVDSLGPRGINSVCNYKREESLAFVQRRVQDAYDARSYLARLSFVDKNEIAVMGWSHGGWTTLGAILNEQNAFRAAIAFYPVCSGNLSELKIPLLILIGEKDDWTPARACRAMLPAGETSPERILKVYPGAYHGFDNVGANVSVMGASGAHRLLYDQEAAEDAAIQVRNFLKMNIRNLP